MVAVPTYQSTQRDRPATQTMRRNSATPESFGAGVGRALQQGGEAAQIFSASLVARKALEEDGQRREQQELFRGDAREILLEPEGGYYNKTGTQALGDARSTAAERLEKARQDRASTLTGRAKQDFLASTSDMTQSQLDQMAKHESGESRKSVVAAHEATINGYREDALQYWQNPVLFEQNLQKAVDEQTGLAGLTGTPKEVLDGANKALVSEVVRQRAILMAKDTPVAAKQFIEDNVGRLSAEHKLELETSLEPLVLAENARSIVSKHLIREGGLDATTRRESGGRTDAQNPGSSASGPSQFIDKTFLNVVGKMTREGKGQLWEGMTKAQILATKTDPSGKYDKAARDYWDNQNAGILKGAGFDKTNANMYALHHFGEGGGPALLKGARDNPSAPAETMWDSQGFGQKWSEIVAVNPWIKPGMSVGDVVRHIRESQGEGTYLGMGGVPRFDAASAYAEASSIKDPKLQAEVLRQVEIQEALQNKKIGAASSAASEEAFNNYIKGGQTELSIAQQLAMGASGIQAFNSFIHADQTGYVVTDPETYAFVRNMEAMSRTGSRQAQQDFAEMNLYQYADKLDRGVFMDMLDRQAEVTAGIAGSKMTDEQLATNPRAAVKVTPEIRTSIARVYEAFGGAKAGTPAAKEAQFRVEEMLRNQMEEYIRTEKKEPSEDVINDMLTAQMLPTNANTGNIWDGPVGRIFDASKAEDGDAAPTVAVEYNEIPAPERAELARVLTAVYGETPTTEQIARAYEDKVLAKGYLATQPYAAEEVPADARAFARMQLGLTDDETALAWQAYMEDVLSGTVDPNTTPFAPVGF